MSTVLARLVPDATDMIRADHARVLTTFHRYKSGAASAAKRSLVATLCLALEVDSALVGRLISEHDRMRSLIGERLALIAPRAMPKANLLLAGVLLFRQVRRRA